MSTKDRSRAAHAHRTTRDRVRLVLNPVTVRLASGTGTPRRSNTPAAPPRRLRTKGVTYVVTDPRIIDAAEAFTRVSPAHARVWRRFGIAHYLELKTREDT
ncbi:hypothetical protein GCM10027258_39900 [Amycolatopsis stemonae]